MRRSWVLFVLLVATPAFADTDYKCLADCKNNGGSSQICLKDCSFVPNEQPKPVVPAGHAHDEFAAPVPVGAVTMPPRNMPNAKKIEPDARCVQDCARSGMQYTLCEKRCLPKL